MERERIQRTQLLIGEDGVRKLHNSHVLVVGLGGVGGYAAEQLARAGIGKMTIVDGDCVDISNCNRQLIALSSTIGRRKTEVIAARLREINPELELEERFEFIRDEKIDALLDVPYDYAVDAIDSLSPKIHLILGCRQRNIPLIASMGSGGKRNPALVQTADIAKTHGCALARAVRKRLRDHGVDKGVECVFSPEEIPASAIVAYQDVEGTTRSTVGTISYMPAIFGCVCASAVLRKLLGL